MAATLSSFLAADLDVGAVRPETTPTTLGADDGGAEDGDSGQKEEQEAGIRLFSHSTRSVRVWSSSPSGPDAGGGFVVPRRPMDHYVASQPDAATRERLAFAAVSGDEVLAMARRRNWGLELPWRVMHISAADGAGGTLKSTAEMMAAEADGGRGHAHLGVTHSLSANKKKRPGKKTRIAQRTKARKLKAKAEVEEAERRAKEAHLRDKKKRLNRSKKLRRREKEREKKLQKAVGGGLEDAGQQNAARAGSAGEDGASD